MSQWAISSSELPLETSILSCCHTFVISVLVPVAVAGGVLGLSLLLLLTTIEHLIKESRNMLELFSLEEMVICGFLGSLGYVLELSAGSDYEERSSKKRQNSCHVGAPTRVFSRANGSQGSFQVIARVQKEIQARLK